MRSRWRPRKQPQSQEVTDLQGKTQPEPFFEDSTLGTHFLRDRGPSALADVTQSRGSSVSKGESRLPRDVAGYGGRRAVIVRHVPAVTAWLNAGWMKSAGPQRVTLTSIRLRRSWMP